jgi:hypothetical protein
MKTLATFGKTLRVGVPTALLLGGLALGAQGFVSPGVGGSFGGESRGVLQISGTIFCAECDLAEVSHAPQPVEGKLYQLTHRQGQLVMDITALNGAPRWSTHLGLQQLSVRAKDSVFAQLTAEENMFKTVELTGMLRTTRTLDIAHLEFPGPDPLAEYR